MNGGSGEWGKRKNKRRCGGEAGRRKSERRCGGDKDVRGEALGVRGNKHEEKSARGNPTLLKARMPYS